MIAQNKDRFTVTHRILHWTIAVLMGFLIITGFLRMNWMSKKAIIEVVSTQTKSQNIMLEREQIIPVVRSIQAPMWKWHEYAAYFMSFAFLGRIIYMIVKVIKFPLPLFAEKQTLNELLQGITYIIFYPLCGLTGNGML